VVCLTDHLFFIW